VIFDHDVPGERHFICEDVVVTDNAVVCHVNSDHEKVAGPDTGYQSLAVGPVKSAELTNDVVVADFEVAPLTFELNILRLAANNCVLENAVAGAETGESFDDSVRSDLAIWANFDVILDDGCGMNGHSLQEIYGFTRFSG